MRSCGLRGRARGDREGGQPGGGALGVGAGDDLVDHRGLGRRRRGAGAAAGCLSRSGRLGLGCGGGRGRRGCRGRRRRRGRRRALVGAAVVGAAVDGVLGGGQARLGAAAGARRTALVADDLLGTARRGAGRGPAPARRARSPARACPPGPAAPPGTSEVRGSAVPAGRGVAAAPAGRDRKGAPRDVIGYRPDQTAPSEDQQGEPARPVARDLHVEVGAAHVRRAPTGDVGGQRARAAAYDASSRTCGAPSALNSDAIDVEDLARVLRRAPGEELALDAASSATRAGTRPIAAPDVRRERQVERARSP